jgi:hypothetical protein
MARSTQKSMPIMTEPISFLGSLPNVVKSLTPQTIAAIAVVAGIVALSPDPLLGQVGLLEFRTSYRSTVGAVFVISVGLSTAHGLFVVGNSVLLGIGKTLKHRKNRKRVHELTENEKRILRLYVDGGSRTQDFELNDGDVAGLVRANILYQATTAPYVETWLNPPVQKWAFNIHSWAWNYFKKHPDLIAAVPVRIVGASKSVPPA